MTYEYVITLLFRFINSGIVIGLLGYLVKKYVYPVLRQGYYQEKEEQAQQEQQVALLIQAKEQETIAISQDLENYQTLKRKIEMWHQVCVMVHKKAEQERAMQQERLRKHAEDQVMEITKTQLIRQAGPQIIEQVRKKLVGAAAEGSKAHAMIEHIIQSINKADHGSHQ